MNNTINFYKKNVYGKSLSYVSDKTQKHAIALISGKCTLDASVKTGLERLGFTFVEVLESSIK